MKLGWKVTDPYWSVIFLIGGVNEVSKRTKISLYIFVGLLVVYSIFEPFILIFITLPLFLVAVGYVASKKVLKKLPEGMLSILIAVLVGGVAVFLASVVAYTAVEMLIYGTSNSELDRQEILVSAGRTAQHVIVFLAFLLAYQNFLRYLDNRKKQKDKTLSSK